MLIGSSASIAFMGHKEERFSEKSFLDKCVDDAVFLINKQSEGSCILFVNGSRGISNRVCSKAIENKIRYKMFLPHSLAVYREMKDEQADKIEQQISNKFCSGMYVADTYYDEDNLMERNRQMIDEATFLVVFWLGRKLGETFECIKYAFEIGKIVYNAYGETITQLQIKDIR